MKLVKKLVGVGVVAVMGLTFATGAFADTKTQDVDVTINGGGLHLTVPNIKKVHDINLTEHREVADIELDGGISIKDLTGTQAGWRLEVSATPLERTSDQYKLPTGTLGISAPENIGVVGNLGVQPYPEIMTQGATIDNGNVTVASAKEGEGMGHYRIDFRNNMVFFVGVDATSAKEGTYESTITWNLVTGP